MPQSLGPRLAVIAAMLAGGLSLSTAARAENGPEGPTGSIGRDSQARSQQDRDAEPSSPRVGQPDFASRPGRSPPDPDQDLARAAMARGQVVPLDRVLRKAADFVPGDMLDVRLRSTREGSWIYEIRMLSSDGRIRVVVIDAARNDVIEVRRP
jgi:uncharacterized membrane protein YkoI